MSKTYNDMEEECCRTHEGSAAFYLDQDHPGPEYDVEEFHKNLPKNDLEAYREFQCKKDYVWLTDPYNPPF